MVQRACQTDIEVSVWLVGMVGLGALGKKYQNTYHSVKFRCPMSYTSDHIQGATTGHQLRSSMVSVTLGVQVSAVGQ